MSARLVVLGCLVVLASIAIATVVSYAVLASGVVGSEQGIDPSDSPSGERAEPEESAR